MLAAGRRKVYGECEYYHDLCHKKQWMRHNENILENVLFTWVVGGGDIHGLPDVCFFSFFFCLFGKLKNEN